LLIAHAMQVLPTGFVQCFQLGQSRLPPCNDAND